MTYRLIKRSMVFLQRLIKNIELDQIFDGAAALSYYLILSLFPGILVLLTVTSFLRFDSFDSKLIYWWYKFVPPSTMELLTNVIDEIQGKQNGGLLSFSFLALLWTATSGVCAIMRQLNICYQIQENRNFFKARLVAAKLTLTIVILTLIPLLALTLINWVLKIDLPIEKPPIMDLLAKSSLQYLVFAIVFFIMFAALYYWGPNKKQSFKDVIPGSLTGAISLLIFAKAFGIYINTFANYNKVYGSLGAIIILILILYILGLLILLGGYINYTFLGLELHDNFNDID